MITVTGGSKRPGTYIHICLDLDYIHTVCARTMRTYLAQNPVHFFSDRDRARFLFGDSDYFGDSVQAQIIFGTVYTVQTQDAVLTSVPRTSIRNDYFEKTSKKHSTKPCINI